MADDLIIFSDGQKITAEDTNDNNRYLKSLNTDSISTLQTYIDGQLSQIQTNMTAQLSSINAEISSLQNSINSKTFRFTSQYLHIGAGTTDLSDYLPADSNTYLVWVYNWRSGKGWSTPTTVSTDLFPETEICGLDGDDGRSSHGWALVVLPVGAGRTITINNGSEIKGYMRV